MNKITDAIKKQAENKTSTPEQIEDLTLIAQSLLGIDGHIWSSDFQSLVNIGWSGNTKTYSPSNVFYALKKAIIEKGA